MSRHTDMNRRLFILLISALAAFPAFAATPHWNVDQARRGYANQPWQRDRFDLGEIDRDSCLYSLGFLAKAVSRHGTRGLVPDIFCSDGTPYRPDETIILTNFPRTLK